MGLRGFCKPIFSVRMVRMKKTKLMASEEVSSLCMELALLTHAGLGISDGLRLLGEDAAGEQKLFLNALADSVDGGNPLSDAMRECGGFPDYVCSLTAVGERTGRPEEAFGALSAYYESQARLEAHIRDALFYPAALLLLMLVVIAVLLIKVLPVFDDVFASLGGRMTGLAGGLLMLGHILDSILPGLWVLLAVCAVLLALFAVSGAFRASLLNRCRVRSGDRGISGALFRTHFAQALAMGLQSGLQVEEALDLAASFQQKNPAAVRRCRDCRSRLDQGAGLAEALRDSGLLPAVYCRMLALGIRSGSGDSVMREISQRMEERCGEAIDAKVSRVEPTMVIVISVLVGVILLSAMLPLMNIMSAIG